MNYKQTDIIKLPLVQQIASRRAACDNEPSVLEEKRKEFIRWIRVHFGTEIDFLEMYKFPFPGEGEQPPEVVKTQQTDEPLFNKYHNTLEGLPTEYCFEVDKLEPAQATEVICRTCLSLIENREHFSVWWAKGMRSPHIRIYKWPLEEDNETMEELDDYEFEVRQKQFWRQIVPLDWKHADRGMWQRSHTRQLEFALHWKTGEPFELLFEHVPEPLKQQQNNLVTWLGQPTAASCSNKTYDQYLKEALARKSKLNRRKSK